MTPFGLKLKSKLEVKNRTEASNPGLLLSQKMRGQEPSSQHTQQMEELRRGHQDVSGANQVVVGDERRVRRMMHEALARDNVGVAFRDLPRMIGGHVMEVRLRVFVSVRKDVAEIVFQLVVLDRHRMCDLDPVGLILCENVVKVCGVDEIRRRSAKELTMPRFWCSVDNTRHKPSRRDFREKYQENDAQLPFAPIATYPIDVVHFCLHFPVQ